MACQLRLSTSTIVLFRMLFMCLHTATALCASEVFVLCFFRWLLSSLNVCKIGCLAWFRSRSSGVRDRRAPDYATRQCLQAEIGARGRSRTCTGDDLDVVSLLLDYASGRNGSSSRC